MNGTKSNKNELTKSQKLERRHFIIKGIGYIFLYGAILSFIAAVLTAVAPEAIFGDLYDSINNDFNGELSAEMVQAWWIAGFISSAFFLFFGLLLIIYGQFKTKSSKKEKTLEKNN
ncbi:MAG: hypothetical protein GQ557_00100 [Mycoplasmataceae bacterium]|nr:hypothetical protein [Mycoplasmataceae bacterium]